MIEASAAQDSGTTEPEPVAYYLDPHTPRIPRIVKGLIVHVQGSEVIELAIKRAQYHLNRAALYRSQKDALAAAGIGVENTMSNSNIDPKAAIRDKADSEAALGAEMDFISRHLEKDAVYQLDRGDLERLGICKSRY